MFFGVLETAPALTALFEKYTDIPKGLDKDTLVPLCASPSEPFKTDLEYLRTCNAIFDVRNVYLQLCEKTRELVNAPSPKEEDVKNLSTARTRAEGYLELHRYGLDLVRQRLASHEAAKTLKPRTVRLAQKVDLSDKETYAMAYIVLSYAQMLTCSYGRSYDFPLMAQACEMNIQEGLAFVSASRVHVKEAVISPPEDDPIGYGFKVPFTTCCVLTGMRLSEEVLLKIDKTVLAEVLVEEGNEEYRMLSAGTAEERKLRRSFQSSDDFFGDIAKSDSDKEDSDKDKEEKEESDEKGEKEKEDEAKDIFELMREEVQKEKESTPDITAVADGDSQKLQPYNTNISYLSDRIEWLSVLIRVKTMVQDSMSELNKDMEREVQLREQKAKERMLRGKCEKRLALTHESKWLPRLEKLAMHLQLHPFEKLVLLILTANVLSPKISPDSSRYSSRVDNFTVGNLIGLFAEGFEQEIDFRKYFYKTATLVKEGLISMQEGFRNSELMNKDVQLDRRMLDFIVGLDTEFSELVEGSHLYTPTVKLDRVVLPESQKDLIVDTVRNFEHFQKAKKRLGLDEVLTYGSGMVLLFYGKSGTGKTMMANAVANMLGKRILLINYPSLGYMGADQAIKFVFREAKLTDSIIFFDECESIFLSRDKAEGAVNLLLTELEMHNQLVIMATNRAFDLDEAMHRRVTLAIEFRMPDPLLRKAIWKAHIPESIKLAEDVNFDELALKYELSGGFIKNTVLAALSSAVSRNPIDPIVTMDDLRAGSGNQLRGRLAMVEFDRRVVPMHGLDDIVVSPEVLTKLRRIVHMDKARQVLYSEWGYAEKGGNEQGITVLLHGPPGCGKTLAAEAIGFETGKPLKVVNTTELVSKWVGDTGKNIEGLFSEAKSLDAILVFDDAEALFGARHQNQSSSTDRYANMDTSVLLYHMERFPGIAVVTTNLLQSLDQAFFRRFRFIVEFDMPKAIQREQLWKRLLPPKAPIAPDVDFKVLGEKYKFSGGVIKNCCFKAAASAALRIAKDERIIQMKDLVEAAEEENVLSPPDSNIYV